MKAFILFTLLLLTFGKQAESQMWCPTSAIWHYDYENSFGVYGYVQLEYTGDTIIEGQLSQKLKKDLYRTGSNWPTINHYELGYEITYQDGDIVYIQSPTGWDTLYNFNAQVGDIYPLSMTSKYGWAGIEGFTMVIDNGIIDINGQSRRFYVNVYNIEHEFGSSYWELNDTIVEGIGSINYYLYALDNMVNSMTCGGESGPFRCYSDNNLGTFKVTNYPECDFVIGIEEQMEKLNLEIFPNPSSDIIYLKSDKRFHLIEIYDTCGQRVHSSTNNNFIDVSHLSHGVYILKAYSDNTYSTTVVVGD
ncbi:MAG: T9SS type A sorting domain-containing protein [Chitinophagales bacterium]